MQISNLGLLQHEKFSQDSQIHLEIFDYNVIMKHKTLGYVDIPIENLKKDKKGKPAKGSVTIKYRYEQLQHNQLATTTPKRKNSMQEKVEQKVEAQKEDTKSEGWLTMPAGGVVVVDGDELEFSGCSMLCKPQPTSPQASFRQFQSLSIVESTPISALNRSPGDLVEVNAEWLNGALVL
eukprot:767996-Hanusia_phi.AAC.1